MKLDRCSRHFLFGGAYSSIFPTRFKEYEIEVSDNREKYVDNERDEILMFDVSSIWHDVADDEAATWFFQLFASNNKAQEVVIEKSATYKVRTRRMPGMMFTTCSGQMVLADQSVPVSEQQQSLAKVFVANLRLKHVSKDIVITAFAPAINETASSAGDETEVPEAEQIAYIAMAYVFTLILDTFIVNNDWIIFY